MAVPLLTKAPSTGGVLPEKSFNPHATAEEQKIYTAIRNAMDPAFTGEADHMKVSIVARNLYRYFYTDTLSASQELAAERGLDTLGLTPHSRKKISQVFHGDQVFDDTEKDNILQLQAVNPRGW